jgi:xylulokinase
MTEKLILSVDLGTSGMKVALVTIDGHVLGWEVEPLWLILTPDGGVEQNPDEWWQAFISAASRLIRRVPDAGRSIFAVCCSTQGEGTVPVDKDGNTLSNAILWLDIRGASHLKRQLGGGIKVGETNILKAFKFIRLTGGMPSTTGKDPAGHMLFIRDAKPDLYARTYKFLNVLDFMNFRLTGRFVATYDSIATSWLTDNRRPNEICYDGGLVSMLGIDHAKLPELVPCSEVLGTLRKDVADTLGLSPAVKVVAGAIDNSAAAIGAGTVDDFDAHLYIGTSSWMAAHVPYKKTDIASSMASIPCAVPGKYLLTALQAMAGGNLTYLRDNILYHKDELLQEAELPDIFKFLDQIASRVPAGSNGVLYTPWIWGERAPVDDKTVRAGLYNLSINNTRDDILRAFLEGIALNTRWLLKPVEGFIGRKVKSLNMVGGGAQSDVWCQIFADVLDVEIRQVVNPIYANARGAAWIAAVGLGEISFSDVPRLVEFKKIFSPYTPNRIIYDDRFDIFKQIYKQMKPVFQRLNAY